MADDIQQAGGGEGTGGEGSSAGSSGIMPGMSETEIRQAGLAVDVPFETAGPQLDRLQYADLGKTWTPPDGWPPATGQVPSDDDDQEAPDGGKDAGSGS